MNGTTCRADVFTGVEEPMKTQRFKLSRKIEPGTAIFKIPSSVTDTFLVPANCALNTVFKSE